MNVTNLKTLHQKDPLGIDRTPYFSWVMESDENDVIQTAYRLRVRNPNGEVWDTGKRCNDTSCFVLYDGPTLTGRTEYSSEVTVWDNHGHEAAQIGIFETALLNKKDWKGRWIESALHRKKSRPRFGGQPPATMFRQAFTLKQTVKKARLYATCHGIYRLTVNGVRPDDREFAPEHTSYGKYLCYQTYDVTSLLRADQNVLGMYVGDGWYNGPGTKPNIRHFRACPAVLFQLEVTYHDGSTDTVCSDETAVTAFGPVIFSDLYAGEKYDARQEIENWAMPGFVAEGWIHVIPVAEGYDPLRAQLGQPVRPVMELPAKEVFHDKKDEWIVDFGQVMAGRVRLSLSEARATKIQLDYFEALDKDGSYFNNIVMFGKKQHDLIQHDEYIAKGGPAVYEPLFTFHGFRYVRVTGLQQVAAEQFTAVVLSTEMDDTGTFVCSDARLNRLYENTRWSQRSNMFSIPTDCPQREKAGWTGDIQIYAATALQNADATPMLTRWLDNVVCDQGKNGAVPMVVPYDGFYPNLGRMLGLVFGNKGHDVVGQAGWGDAAVLVPYAMYQVTGNTAVLKQQYLSMKNWCEYVINTAKEQRGKNKLPKEIDQYLWNTGFHWGEWLIPSLSLDGDLKKSMQCNKLTCSYIAPIFGYLSVSRMGEIAEVLENKKDAEYYRTVAQKMKDAFIFGVIGQNGEMPARYMGAYVSPLRWILYPSCTKNSLLIRWSK